jgi:hypothetical protein
VSILSICYIIFRRLTRIIHVCVCQLGNLKKEMLYTRKYPNSIYQSCSIVSPVTFGGRKWDFWLGDPDHSTSVLMDGIRILVQYITLLSKVLAGPGNVLIESIDLK